MSKLDQLNSRPPTLALSTRIDARHLATLARLWSQQGESPRSTSELVRLSLETFAEVLVTSGQVEFVQTQAEAQEVLGGMGLLGRSQLKRNLVEAIVREGNINEALSPAQNSQSTSRGGFTKDDPHYRMAQQRLAQELSRSIGQFEAEDKKDLGDTLSALGSLPD